ncbi:MAG: histidine phosphatase family protein, partial [Casimicrobium sp.]
VRPDTVSLSGLGQMQAIAAGDEFAKLRLKFDRVLVSGLLRTSETAMHVLRQLPHAPRIEINKDWDEIPSGKLSEIPPDQVEKAFLEVFSAKNDVNSRFVGGESVGKFLGRIIPPMDALRADPSWDCVLVVLHGGVNRALLSYLLTGEARLYGGFAQDPGCINAIDVGPEKHDTVLRVVNFAPLDRLQTQTRKTTMEELLEKFQAYRKRLTGEPHE